MRKGIRYKLSIVLFILPTIFIFLIVVAYPIVQSLMKSFYSWNGYKAAEWVGLGNYTKIFQDDLFWLSSKNVLIFSAVLVIYEIGIGMLLALLLYSMQNRFLKAFCRFSFFLPVVLSVTVVCQLWLKMYNYDYGLFNQLFQIFGIDYRQNWLTSENSAIFVLAFTNAWQYMGISFIMFYTAINGLPKELFEAAKIDGVSAIGAHRYITIPLLKDTVRFCLILAITNGIKAFDQSFIMTAGGPGDYTMTLTYMMYKGAFIKNKFGYGSAVAAIIVVICILCTFIINRIFREKEERV